MMNEVKKSYPKLDWPQVFIYWFLWIYFEWSEDTDGPPKAILNCICDNPNDKSIDAINFDDNNKIIYIIQSKYTQDFTSPSRLGYAELKRAADVIQYFETYDKDLAIYKNANQRTQELLGKAFDKKDQYNYRLKILFITNKKPPTEKTREEVYQIAQIDPTAPIFEIIARPQIVTLYNYYLEGASPPLPEIFLKTHDDKYVLYDNCKGARAYITVIPVGELTKLFNKYHRKIFNRNIRAYQGSTSVNKAILKTLEIESKLFFFKNSGISILCDDATFYSEAGFSGFKIKNLQIINGQQTTRQIAKKTKSDARVMAIIITLRETEQEKIIGIIAARNYQNRISAADLKANDPIQVKLGRLFRELGYFYERKKREWRELNKAQRAAFPQSYLTKVNLAKLSLAMIDDPFLSYKGDEYIFGERYKEVFDLEKFTVDEYAVMHLIYSKYVMKIGRKLYNKGTIEALSAQYHVFSFLMRKIGLNKINSRELRERLELWNKNRQPNSHLERCIRILWRLSQKYLVKARKLSPDEGLSANKLFKKREQLKEMEKFLRSRKLTTLRRSFKKNLKKFLTSINKTEN